jgi:hypothetical protein
MVKVKGISMVLGDGATYVVPPLNLFSLELLQDRLQTFAGGLDKDSVSLIVDATHMALQRNYPDVSRETVSQLLDVANMLEVMAALMDVSGLARKAAEAAQGEDEKKQMPLIGDGSTPT